MGTKACSKAIENGCKHELEDVRDLGFGCTKLQMLEPSWILGSVWISLIAENWKLKTL